MLLDRNLAEEDSLSEHGQRGDHQQPGPVVISADGDALDYLMALLRWHPRISVDVLDRREDAVVLVRPALTPVDTTPSTRVFNGEYIEHKVAGCIAASASANISSEQALQGAP